MSTLVIPYVNLDLLDQQRMTLEDLYSSMVECGFGTDEELAALDGVIGMLDEWSDGHYEG